MTLLGGLFTRGPGGAAKSKSTSDLSASAPHTSTNSSYAQTSSQSQTPSRSTSGNTSGDASPTADYVSFTPQGVVPSSPNGRGLAYAGEPQKERRGFFGRKRSATNEPPRDTTNVSNFNTGSQYNVGTNGLLDPFAGSGMSQGGMRPGHLARLSTASDLPPPTTSGALSSSPLSGGPHARSSNYRSGSPAHLRPPPQGMYSASTRSLPPPSPSSPSHLHSYAGSPLAPSVSPTKSTLSTRTSKTSRSTGAKSKTEGREGGRRFAFWVRGKSSPSVAKDDATDDAHDGREGEFSLRAFRHVSPVPPMPALPTAMSNTSTPSKRGSKQGQGQGAQLTAHTLAQLQDQNASAEGLVRPRPRPRGTSDASSSRISVAAFREARRAPSPALGVYSPGGPQQHHQEAPYPSQQQQQRAPVPPPKTTPGKHGHGKTAQPQRRAGHARENQWESDDNESESGDERGEQPAGGGTDGGKSPSASKARSELGHGGTSGLGMGIRAQRLSQSQLPPLQTHALVPSLSQSQSSQSQHSHATTYSQPHRPPQPQPPKPQLSSSTSDSISSSEEDSDDAPLATLVAPRRPGSALSLVASSRGSSTNLHASAPGSYTNLANSHSNLAAGHAHSNLAPSPVSATSRGPPKTKPLIDIASLTASRPAVKEQGRSAEGFTGVGMLASLSGSSPSTRNNTSSMAASTTASPVLTSRSPPNLEQRGLVQFPSPPSSPVREVPPAIGGREEKRSPMRKEAGGNVVSLDNPGAPGKRDVLSDRLRAVAAVNLESERQRARTGSPPARMLTASPPARTLSDSPPAIRPGTPPMTRPAPPPTKRSASPPAVVARSPPLRTKPAPPIAARKAFHRRSSSDIISGRPQRMWGQEDDDGGDGALGRDLADMLGGGIALVSRAGESPPSPEKMRPLPPAEEDQDKDRIAPIVIKQRAPPPAFSVTSRPQNRSISSFGDLDVGGRQRSSTLVPISSVPDTFNSGNSSNSNYSSSAAGSEARSFASGTGSSSGVRGNARQRSSTMMPLGSGVVTSSPSSSPPVASPSPPAPAPTPIRPFATPRAAGARPSPASSTGDSSSGPAPLTPKDGSDVDGAAWSGGVSGLVARGGRGPVQRRSVSFDFEEGVRLGTGAEGKGKGKPRETPVQEEERRRERRRSEARAAIELGNVINGRGPIDEDEDGGGGDSDDDVPINRARAGASQMMGTMNMPMNNMPMNAMMGNMGNVGMNMGMSGWQPGMLSPAQFMTPPPADPAFFAAHQQAMMIAKQAYQMAVAQQAMAVAGDEWERGSAYGGAQSEYGGGGGRPSSVYGGAASSVYGGGASSVYGGSAYGGAAGPAPFMGMGGGMGMGMQGGWSPGGGMLFPPAPRSMYGGGGGSGARSDYGGGGGGSGGGWNSSRSVYGESFGPSTDRFAKSGSGGSGGRNLRERAESGYFPPGPGVPQGQGRPGPGQQGPGNPRQRTASQPANPSRNAGANARRPPPPSSWKASP